MLTQLCMWTSLIAHALLLGLQSRSKVHDRAEHHAGRKDTVIDAGSRGLAGASNILKVSQTHVTCKMRADTGRSLEVDKDALGSLWSEEARLIALGADGCREHEVEVEGR